MLHQKCNHRLKSAKSVISAKKIRKKCAVSSKTTIFERFLKHLIINMPNIFDNRVYLNIKERDRF
ncbi:MAG: hypothetical protein IKZ55_02785 [Bacteroidales bacterium]|nr:hypothetical protein [Bacteroidales bacterium]